VWRWARRRAAVATGRSTAAGSPGPGRGGHPPARCRDGGTAPAHESTTAWPRARTSPGRDTCRPAPPPPSEAEDGIEHGARGVGQRPTVDDRHRRADAPSPTEKAPSVGLELSAAAGLSLDDDRVGGPDGCL